MVRVVVTCSVIKMMIEVQKTTMIHQPSIFGQVGLLQISTEIISTKSGLDIDDKLCLSRCERSFMPFKESNCVEGSSGQDFIGELHPLIGEFLDRLTDASRSGDKLAVGHDTHPAFKLFSFVSLHALVGATVGLERNLKSNSADSEFRS